MRRSCGSVAHHNSYVRGLGFRRFRIHVIKTIHAIREPCWPGTWTGP